MLYKNKTVGILTIFSVLVALASLVFSAIFVNYHFEAFANPSIILALQNVNATAGKWSMICDMLGYYMLLLPVIFYMHDWLKNKTAWCNIITFCGLAYVIIGSIGASILAVIWPNTIHAFALASPAEKQVIQANFNMANTIVYDGIWNLLEEIFAGVWWLATGILLFKNKVKGVAVIAAVTGIASLLDPLAAMVESNAMHQVALNIYLYTAIIWAIWMGIVTYRNVLINTNKKAATIGVVQKKKAAALITVEL